MHGTTAAAVVGPLKAPIAVRESEIGCMAFVAVVRGLPSLAGCLCG